MSKETNKRLVLSVAGGALIPYFYFLCLFVLSGLLNILGVGFSGHYFDSLSTPVTWAGNLYDYIIPTPIEPIYSVHLRPVAWITSVIGDFLLYSLLTYIFLRSHSKYKWR